MPGDVYDLSKQKPPREIVADICIVGSGCGGATAAWVLAKAGRDVVVLEEGGDFTGTQLTGRDGAMYDQLYMDRGARATTDLSVNVLQARVLGGGGVINASDVVPVSDAVLRHWQKRFGLSELSPETLAPYKKRALEDLSASRIQEKQVNRANALLRAGAKALNLRGEVMLNNRVGCVGTGTCLIGCPFNAKRNPRFVAIPAALEAGARFYTRARATRITGGEREMKRITVKTLDERGYRVVGETSVRARIVILAANAVASAELLLRSGLGNQHVGRNLLLQPQLPVTAVFPEPLTAFRGIPQSYAVTEFEVEDHPEHGLWGYRIEGIMGTPGMVASLLPFSGVEGKKAMQLYDRIAASLLLVIDRPSGNVKLSNGRLAVEYYQKEDHKQRLRDAIKQTARIYFEAGAERIIVPTTPPLTFERGADLLGRRCAHLRRRFGAAAIRSPARHRTHGAILAPRRRGPQRPRVRHPRHLRVRLFGLPVQLLEPHDDAHPHRFALPGGPPRRQHLAESSAKSRPARVRPAATCRHGV